MGVVFWKLEFVFGVLFCGWLMFSFELVHLCMMCLEFIFFVLYMSLTVGCLVT